MGRVYTWAGMLVGFVFFFVFITLIISILSYVLHAYGLYTIAKRRGHKDPWMAWVPFASRYLYADLISRDLEIGRFTLRNFPIFFTFSQVGISILSYVAFFTAMIPIIGWIIGGLFFLALVVFSAVAETYVSYRFYRKLFFDQVILFTILSAVVPLAEPIILFAIRNRSFVHPKTD